MSSIPKAVEYEGDRPNDGRQAGRCWLSSLALGPACPRLGLLAAIRWSFHPHECRDEIDSTTCFDDRGRRQLDIEKEERPKSKLRGRLHT